MLKLVTGMSRESLNGGSTAAKREVFRCGLRRQVFSGALEVLVSVAESLVGVQSPPQVRTHNSKQLLLNLIFPTLTVESPYRFFVFFALFHLSASNTWKCVH